MIGAIERGTLTDDDARARAEELAEERENLTNLIEIESRRAEPAFKPIDMAEAQEVANAFRTRLADAPPAKRKQYLEGLVSQVVVGPDTTEISGAKSCLTEAVAAIDSDTLPSQPTVRIFDREWWS